MPKIPRKSLPKRYTTVGSTAPVATVQVPVPTPVAPRQDQQQQPQLKPRRPKNTAKIEKSDRHALHPQAAMNQPQPLQLHAMILPWVPTSNAKTTPTQLARKPLNKRKAKVDGPNYKKLLKVSEHLAKNGAMPGYGQVYVNGSHVWYVGGDGDEWEEKNLPIKLFSEVPGVKKVTYEAEAFPPEKREPGWVRVGKAGKANR